jgi:hypothetical protein
VKHGLPITFVCRRSSCERHFQHCFSTTAGGPPRQGMNRHVAALANLPPVVGIRRIDLWLIRSKVRKHRTS